MDWNLDSSVYFNMYYILLCTSKLTSRNIIRMLKNFMVPPHTMHIINQISSTLESLCMVAPLTQGHWVYNSNTNLATKYIPVTARLYTWLAARPNFKCFHRGMHVVSSKKHKDCCLIMHLSIVSPLSSPGAIGGERWGIWLQNTCPSIGSGI